MELCTVEIGNTSYKTLQEIAARSGESIPQILDRAIEQYRKQKFLSEANQAYIYAIIQKPGQAKSKKGKSGISL